MEKYMILAICLSILYGNLEAQDDLGVLYWTEDRDLVWDDFKGASLPNPENDFFLDLHIESITTDHFTFYVNYRYEPKVYVFTQTSYVQKEKRNSQLLRFFNVYYDLAAYYGFKSVERMVKANNSDDEFYRNNRHILQDALAAEWKRESQRLTIETQSGENSSRLIYWENEVRSKLATLSSPIYTKSDYSCTLDLTVGALIGLQDYKDYLTQPVALALGVELAKAPFTYNFGLTGGGTRVKQSFSDGDDIFAVDTEPSLLNLYLHLGYQLIDSKHIRITPRAGMHFSHLSYSEDDDIESSHWSNSYTAGMMVDFKFNNWKDSASGELSYSEIALRIGTYYYPFHVGNANVSNVLVTAGFAWTFGAINANYD